MKEIKKLSIQENVLFGLRRDKKGKLLFRQITAKIEGEGGIKKKFMVINSKIAFGINHFVFMFRTWKL
jgi:hypothetical protein